MPAGRARFASMLVFIAVTLVAASPIRADAATSVVHCPTDDLASAFLAAAPGDTVRISGTCTGNFTVNKRLTLLGTPGATLDGAGAGTTLTVTARRPVVVRGLRITGGSDVDGTGAGIHNTGRLILRNSIVDGNVGQLEGSLGGGIFNSGSLAVHHSIVRRNGLGGFFSAGGGIYNSGEVTIRASTLTGNSAYGGGNLSSHGTATVRGSTISDGDSAGAGGIESSGRLTLENSTVSGNSSFFIGGIFNSGIARISNVTISGNSGAAGGVTNGGGSLTLTSTTVSGNLGTEFEGPGGINAMSGIVVLRSSIVAGNVGGTVDDCGGRVSSKGYNLIGDADGCIVTATTGDRFGSSSGSGAIDPRLGPLSNNGGGTRTMAVLPFSPARDAIPVGARATGGTPLCPAAGSADQRHVPRPQGPACDMGAFERRTP